MRKILPTGVNKKKLFAILSHFQRMGIIFFILGLPYVSFSQQTEKAATIEGQLIKSIPSLKDFKPDLISLQTSLPKEKIGPSLENLSAKLVDYGTKAKGDPVVQQVSSTAKLALQETNTLAGIPSTADKNFDGLGFSNLSPASPSIVAGPNHIIQMINGPTGAFFKIWDRDGNIVIGQTILSSLFGGGGYLGKSYPIAIYDQFADRYMMTELGTVGGSILVNTLVVAISQTNDPTGGWNLYKFTDNSFYHDYPHFAAWPNALYATTNDWAYNGSFFTYLGSSIYAIDKNQMVAGNLTVPLIRYRIVTNNDDFRSFTVGPVNVSGTTPPAAGSPGMFMYFSDDNFTFSSTDVDSVGFISLQPDFTIPANSVTSFFQQIAVAPFKSGLCNYVRQCIPAPGGQYDAVSDRFMHRIYYRNFGTHESIVANHTVDANYPNLPQRAGVRWYEFRRTGGEWSTYQQSTYSPDVQSRWMGSIGINSKGQIALSYNLASPTKFGSFYFTGRNSGDPLNQMSIADNAIINGSGYGTFSSRWGAYNDMATDIVNDSLFWTTAMYGYTSTTWKTRIAAIKIGDMPVVLPTPPTVTINQAAGQSDPTSGSPIHFTVTFDQAVTGFTSSDISFIGSTPFFLFSADVTVTGGPIVYDVAVSGMTSSGTVVATVPENVVLNAANQSNLASTSTDNSVVYNIPPCTITCPSNITVAGTSLSGAVVNYNVTPDGDCRNIVRIPSTGTVFPVGTTTVNAYNNVSTGLVYALSHNTDIITGFQIDQLVTFNVNTSGPTTLSTPITITGVPFGLVAIDFRPSNDQLYGLSVAWLSSHFIGTIYTINKSTGAATPLSFEYFDLSDGGSWDIDFDPVTDILRVTDGKGTNLRIDPDLGTVIASDPALSAGITATAYSNTFASSTFTTLYEINSSTDALYIQGGINGVPSPNTGSTTLVGPLGIDVEQQITGFGGFDISLSAGALATFLVDGVHKLYSINLSTGAAFLMGTFNGSVIDIAIAPVTLPAASCSFTVTVTPPLPAVTINRASTQADPTAVSPVHFTVVFDQDVTGFDESDISFTGSTVQGNLQAAVTGSGTTYDVAVTGMTTGGTIVASVKAGAAKNSSDDESTASTSTDNTVTFNGVPNIVCPEDVTRLVAGPVCRVFFDFETTYAVNILSPLPTDVSYLITGIGNPTSISTTTTAFLGTGEYLVTATATNPYGTSTCTFRISAVPAPIQITYPESYTVTTGFIPACRGRVNLDDIITVKNSIDVVYTLTDDENNSVAVTSSSLLLPIGNYILTIDAYSYCGSEHVTYTFPIIVVPPPLTIQCPREIKLYDNNNDCVETISLTGDLEIPVSGATGITYEWTDANGNTGSEVITIFGSPDPFTFPVGINTMKVIAEGCNGVKESCTFNIIVVDTESPVITKCAADITVSCAADVPAADITAITATDNCGTPTITHVGDVISEQTCTNKFKVTRTYMATDISGNTATCSQVITVNDNVAPQIIGLSPSHSILAPPNHKMRDVMINYTVADNCVSSPNTTISVTSNEPENGTGDGDTDSDWEIIDNHHVRLRAERAANGSGRIYTITITVNDGCNAPVSATTQVVVAHNITAPHSGNSFRVGSTVAISGEFWDVPGNRHTAKWLIDGNTTAKATVTEPAGNKNGKVTGSYKFTVPGVYKLQMNVTDQNGVTNYANTNGDLEAIVVIYDPNGGHTYGGGYYNSPAGALVSNPSTTGKASYGFAMNYFKNSTNPKGETQFEFKVGEFEFNALNFDYLVINNSMSQFKGTGKIIGGQSGIGFTMTVSDGQLDGSGVDKIRMKIYNKNNGKIIYDNQPGASDAALPTQAVGTNSIIVISGTNSTITSAGKSEKAEIGPKVEEISSELDMIAFPNPSATSFTINVKGNGKTEKITMQVIDMYGRIIETRNVNASSTIRFGEKYRPGTYFVRIIQGKEHKEIKLVKLSD